MANTISTCSKDNGDLVAAGHSGIPKWRAISPIAFVGVLVVAAMLGGCSTQPAMVIKDAAEFDQVVNRTDMPVLMMFSKEACPGCVVLEPTMDQLAGEYKGRAVVAKFTIYTFTTGVTSEDIRTKYHIGFVPDVILFVNGQQRQRWPSDFDIQDYRKALDAAIAAGATTKASKGK